MREIASTIIDFTTLRENEEYEEFQDLSYLDDLKIESVYWDADVIYALETHVLTIIINQSVEDCDFTVISESKNVTIKQNEQNKNQFWITFPALEKDTQFKLHVYVKNKFVVRHKEVSVLVKSAIEGEIKVLRLDVDKYSTSTSTNNLAQYLYNLSYTLPFAAQNMIISGFYDFYSSYASSSSSSSSSSSVFKGECPYFPIRRLMIYNNNIIVVGHIDKEALGVLNLEPYTMKVNSLLKYNLELTFCPRGVKNGVILGCGGDVFLLNAPDYLYRPFNEDGCPGGSSKFVIDGMDIWSIKGNNSYCHINVTSWNYATIYNIDYEKNPDIEEILLMGLTNIENQIVGFGRIKLDDFHPLLIFHNVNPKYNTGIYYKIHGSISNIFKSSKGFFVFGFKFDGFYLIKINIDGTVKNCYFYKFNIYKTNFGGRKWCFIFENSKGEIIAFFRTRILKISHDLQRAKFYYSDKIESVDYFSKTKSFYLISKNSDGNGIPGIIKLYEVFPDFLEIECEDFQFSFHKMEETEVEEINLEYEKRQIPFTKINLTGNITKTPVRGREFCFFYSSNASKKYIAKLDF